MREREKAPSERNPSLQWNVVSKRKPRSPSTPKASRTCFVNFLPSTMNTTDIAAMFKIHGTVDSVYIPSGQLKKPHQCAFVRFIYPQSLLSAIRDEHGRCLGNHRITVHHAKFDKPPDKPNHRHHNPSPLHTKPPAFDHKTFHPTHRPAHRDSRTYKEAFSNIHPEKSSSQSTPKPPPVPKSTYTLPNPPLHRVMSSRALGEDTEKTRESLGEIDIEGEFAAALKGEACEEIKEMLERSAVAVANSSQSSEDILSHILAEGVNCLKIKPMGGMLHLIIFETFADKKEMMECKWLEKWFLVLRNVNDESAMVWRETWLKVQGMPLIAWSHENFYKIGCVYGRVISVNQKDFECAYILVFTDYLFQINNLISMEIQGKQYSIFVSEANSPGSVMQKSSHHPGNHVHGIAANQSPNGMGSPSKSNPRNLTPPSAKSDQWKSKEVDTNHLISISKKPPKSQNVISFPPENLNEPFPGKPHGQPFRQSSVNDWSGLGYCSPQKRKNNHSQSPMREPIDFSSPSKIIEVPPPKSLPPKKPPAQPTTSTPLINSPNKPHLKNGPIPNPPKQNHSSSGTIDSSSGSGPLFPPGFEDRVPSHIKIAQLEKRKKKLEKKKRLKFNAQSKMTATPPPKQLYGAIAVDDVIELASLLGLSFDGQLSELRRRIQVILQGQVHTWDNHQ
uniref:RRM domain-containing protein n=1 Tax=Beta vulgaris subsp. vulgaris TaxID=3555 RepID=F4NCL2_BETVV|nr:hypothetical protein [Beta vulgaris subsp. vulgaris]